MIHHKWDAHPCRHLAENISDNRIEQELPELVLNGSNRFTHEPLVISRVFLSPECSDEGVFDLSDDLGAERRIDEKPINAQKGCIATIEQGRHSVVEDVFEARSPGVAPDSFEGAHNAGCDEVSVIRRDIREHVEPNGKLQITRIEI